MVKYRSLDETFAALADPTRRAILERLRRGDCNVTELAQPFAISLPAISKHLRVLERAGLIRQEKQGRVRRCCLCAGPMHAALSWIDRYRDFWSDKLDALADYFEQGKHEEEQT